MPKNAPPAKIFLSHSVADIELVEAFETLLSKALNITSESIFCSSLEGQGVAKGSNFVDAIKVKAEEAMAVVALISPAYMESAFCLAELGAAWVLNTRRFPIVVPPNNFEVMQATLLGVVGVRIDQREALSQLLEEVSQALSLPPASAGVKARAMRDFENAWPTLMEKVGKPKRVEAAVHNKTVNELKAANEAWEASEQDLLKAKEHIAALEKTKDAAEVAVVRMVFSDTNWEMDLDNAIGPISDLQDEVGGASVLRYMILDHLGKPSIPDLNDDRIARAIEINLYDPDDKSWNQRSDEMRALVRAMKDVENVFQNHPEAVAELKSQNKRHQTDDIRFWEQRLKL